LQILDFRPRSTFAVLGTGTAQVTAVPEVNLASCPVTAMSPERSPKDPDDQANAESAAGQRDPRHGGGEAGASRPGSGPGEHIAADMSVRPVPGSPDHAGHAKVGDFGCAGGPNSPPLGRTTSESTVSRRKPGECITLAILPPLSPALDARSWSCGWPRLLSFWTGARPGQHWFGSRSCELPGQRDVTSTGRAPRRRPARPRRAGNPRMRSEMQDDLAGRRMP
jgi:hypothetical protein